MEARAAFAEQRRSNGRRGRSVASAGLLAALEAYADCLVDRKHPVLHPLRDELRLLRNIDRLLIARPDPRPVRRELSLRRLARRYRMADAARAASPGG